MSYVSSCQLFFPPKLDRILKVKIYKWPYLKRIKGFYGFSDLGVRETIHCTNKKKNSFFGEFILLCVHYINVIEDCIRHLHSYRLEIQPFILLK